MMRGGWCFMWSMICFYAVGFISLVSIDNSQAVDCSMTGLLSWMWNWQEKTGALLIAYHLRELSDHIFIWRPHSNLQDSFAAPCFLGHISYDTHSSSGTAVSRSKGSYTSVRQILLLLQKNEDQLKLQMLEIWNQNRKCWKHSAGQPASAGR